MSLLIPFPVWVAAEQKAAKIEVNTSLALPSLGKEYGVLYRHFGPKTHQHQCQSVRKTYQHWYQGVQTPTVPKCLTHWHRRVACVHVQRSMVNQSF